MVLAGLFIGTTGSADAADGQPGYLWEAPAELPYREVTGPVGGVAPVGAALVIHGGGWLSGAGGVVAMRPQADLLAQQGWLVWNVDHRSGPDAYGDVRMWLEMLEQEFAGPTCALGGSSGGHLALLLAAREGLDCVIAEAGPTDLTRLAPLVEPYAADAFPDGLWENSPLRIAQEDPAAYAETEILLGHAVNDGLVPFAQAREFADLMPSHVELAALDNGVADFPHRTVAEAGLAEFHEMQRRLLARIARPGSAFVQDGTLSIHTAEGAASKLQLSHDADVLVLSDPAGLAAGAGCAQSGRVEVRCAADGVSAAEVEAGDRDDSAESGLEIPTGIAGGDGDDRLVSGGGGALFDGGSGRDEIVPGPGSDSIVGGEGADSVTYGDRVVGVSLSPDGFANDGEPGERDDIAGDIETLVGGLGADSITGGEPAETLFGGPGADELSGGAGDDALDGGGGADLLDGAEGLDFVDYGTRSSSVTLSLDGVANDGEAGEGDQLTDTNEALIGGEGRDRLLGDAAAQWFWGMGGNDRITPGGGADVIRGGARADTLDYARRADAITVTLDDVANDGAPGEAANVFSDIEIVRTGSGADTLVGGAAAERFYGGGGADSIDAGAANDLADGGAGRDSMLGGDGADTLGGGGGDDALDGGPGPDLLAGGIGTDTADYSGRTAAVALSLDGVANDGEPGEEDNIGMDVEALAGGGGGDTLTGGPAADVLSGFAGEDRLDGLASADRLEGGADGDVLDGGTGTDALYGNGGGDTVTYAGRADPLSLSLDGKPNDGAGGEADLIGSDVESLVGGAGPDRLVGSAGANQLYGEDGGDELVGGSYGDRLAGGGGADVIDAGPGRDSVEGGAGDDNLSTRDGTLDSVSCADGEDTLLGDLLDSVLSGCELVELL